MQFSPRQEPRDLAPQCPPQLSQQVSSPQQAQSGPEQRLPLLQLRQHQDALSPAMTSWAPRTGIHLPHFIWAHSNFRLCSLHSRLWVVLKPDFWQLVNSGSKKGLNWEDRATLLGSWLSVILVINFFSECERGDRDRSGLVILLERGVMEWGVIDE
jgi:hypothetical protein